MLDGRRGRRRGMGASYIETNGGGKGGEMDGSPEGRRGGGGAGCSDAVQQVRRHGSVFSLRGEKGREGLEKSIEKMEIELNK